MPKNAQLVKGFRDFLPEQANAREYVRGKIVEVFKLFGFESLETPALEFAATLKGKYGEEEKLIYEFKTKGGDEVALRYDQTVPLARVIAQYPELPKPFKRYQIQPVWRGENTQKGRYREFLQCDADSVGSSSPLADAEILMLVFAIYQNLGLDINIRINDRNNFESLDKKYVAAIDKLDRIGESEVLKEMVAKGMAEDEAKEALVKLQSKPMTENLQRIVNILKKMGVDMEKIKYEPTLARGLDYYTGMIFETVAEGSNGSICSGGRWDNMIGQFTGQDQPAVGFGLGFDRTLEVLQEQNLLPDIKTSTKVLVTVFSPDLLPNSLETVQKLRENKINTEIWLDPENKLDKQLKYADQKGIPFAIILGPDEAKNNTITLKDLQNKTQTTLPLDELVVKLSS
ncbi:MAG: histidine--tRNA ligase [Candidatus Daviesbacteria bacterium]